MKKGINIKNVHKNKSVASHSDAADLFLCSYSEWILFRAISGLIRNASIF